MAALGRGLFLLLFLSRVSVAVWTRRIRGDATIGVELQAHAKNRISLHRPQHVPSFLEWDGAAVLEHDDDPLKQVRPLLDLQDSQNDETALVEVGASAGVGKVHAFCEICILIMQMKERGQPHLCAGLNPDYFITVRQDGTHRPRETCSNPTSVPSRHIIKRPWGWLIRQTLA